MNGPFAAAAPAAAAKIRRLVGSEGGGHGCLNGNINASRAGQAP